MLDLSKFPDQPTKLNISLMPDKPSRLNLDLFPDQPKPEFDTGVTRLPTEPPKLEWTEPGRKPTMGAYPEIDENEPGTYSERMGNIPIAKEIGNVAGYTLNSLKTTYDLFNPLVTPEQWGAQVAKTNKSAETFTEDMGTIAGVAGIVMAGVDVAKYAPEMIKGIKGKLGPYFNRFTAESTKLANISDDELVNIFKTQSEEIQSQMAKYNPRVRGILQRETPTAQAVSKEPIVTPEPIKPTVPTTEPIQSVAPTIAEIKTPHTVIAKELQADGTTIPIYKPTPEPIKPQEMADKNILQKEILTQAGIPKPELGKYLLDSMADGMKLRTYSDDVIAGKMTKEQAAELVRQDYAKITQQKPINAIERANEVRNQNILNTKINYAGITKSRKEHIDDILANGGSVEVAQVPSVEFNRTKYNRMNQHEQDEYQKKLDTKKTQYRLNLKDDSFYTITKAEYDYGISKGQKPIETAPTIAPEAPKPPVNEESIKSIIEQNGGQNVKIQQGSRDGKIPAQVQFDAGNDAYKDTVMLPIDNVTPETVKMKIQEIALKYKGTQPTPIAQKAVNAPADEFVYHGTNEQMLDSISKEGLKPSRKGTLSFSKDEAYSTSFARDGMTPQGKTNGVVLRVKSALLEGKTISGNKNRPATDQQHEILTKEVIPPEMLEIKVNGKWQPLKSPQPTGRVFEKPKVAETPTATEKDFSISTKTYPIERLYGISSVPVKFNAHQVKTNKYPNQNIFVYQGKSGWVIINKTTGESFGESQSGSGGWYGFDSKLEAVKKYIEKAKVIETPTAKIFNKTNPLIEEAKKYGTAEEFVKAQSPVNVPIEDVIPTEGHTAELMAKKSSRAEISKEPIRVEFNNKGKLQIQDGNHRYFEAVKRGDKTIPIVFNSQSPDLNFQGEFDRIRKFWNSANKVGNTKIFNKPVETPTAKIFNKGKNLFGENGINRVSKINKIFDTFNGERGNIKTYIRDYNNNEKLFKNDKDVLNYDEMQKELLSKMEKESKDFSNYYNALSEQEKNLPVVLNAHKHIKLLSKFLDNNIVPQTSKIFNQPKAGGIFHKDMASSAVNQYIAKKGLKFVGEGAPKIVRLTQPTTIKDIHGVTHNLKQGEEFRQYELSDNKTLVQDGERFIVSDSKIDDLNRQGVVLGQQEPFGKEFQGLEETVRGIRKQEVTGNKHFVFSDDSGNYLIAARNSDEAAQIVVEETGLDAFVDRYGEPMTMEEAKNSVDINDVTDIGAFEEEYGKLETMGDVKYTAKQDDTKFSQYTLPGGENYREVLIKHPNYKVEPEPSHFGDTATWLRMNDRTTPQGDKVIFIEEIQKNKNLDKVEGHPLGKGKYVENNLKRALKEAVDSDAKYLSWISGEQTADRYNLAKQLDNIKWYENNEGKRINFIPKDSKISLHATIDTQGKIIESGQNDWIGKKIDDVIGKGVSEKILKEKEGSLSGEGLKLGGEWAQNLYDRQIPSILEKMTKRYGGKIETIGIIDSSPNAKEYIGYGGKTIKPEIKQQALKITPEIRAWVKGEAIQPMAGGKMHFEGEGKDAISKEDEVINKVIKALKEAKSVRGQQETLYSQERGRKLGKFISKGSETSGESGFHAQLGQLKGELTKVQYESIRNKLTQEDIDSLFERIKHSPNISDWERITAGVELGKLFGESGGVVPTESGLKVLKDVFGDDLIKALLDKRDLFTTLKEIGYQLFNIPRSIMSSFDLSAPLRQGLFLIGRQKQFLPAFLKQFGAFGSEKKYQAIQESIKAMETYPLARESKLALTDMDSILSKREEQFMSNWAEKIPLVGSGVRASGRAYTAFLNKLRADTFQDLINKADKLGLKPKENIDISKSIAEYVNTATGRGSLGHFERAAISLNSFFFSPRLMGSRIQLLTKMFNPNTYTKKNAFIRKEYLKDLLRVTGIISTVLGLAKLSGMEVGTDPRSSDFLKIKIGKTRFDIMGGFQQYTVMASRLITGELVSSTTGKITTLGEGYRPLNRQEIIIHFLESKEAPVYSFASKLLKGQDITGKPVNIPTEIGNLFVPMVIGGMWDIYNEQPELLPASIASAFGVGVQTYPLKSDSKKIFNKPVRKVTGIRRQY